MDRAIYNCPSDTSSQVHIAPCDKQWCRDKLYQLAKELREAGVACEHKYKPYGPYKTWFESFNRSCSYTILHVCPWFFKKLSTIIDQSHLHDHDFTEKIICVKFVHTEDFSMEEASQEEKAACEKYFLHFSQFDISNDALFYEFVNDVKRAVEEGDSQSTTKPVKGLNLPGSQPLPAVGENPYNNRPYNASPVNDVNSTYINSQGSDQNIVQMLQKLYTSSQTQEYDISILQIVPDMFGQTSGQEVYARVECFSSKDGVLSLLSSLKSLEELQCCLDSLCEQQHEGAKLSAQWFILHKVIPALYDTEHMLALAHVAGCSQQQIQSRALLMMEMLIFEGEAQKNKDNLVKSKSVLAETLAQLSKNSKDEDSSFLMIIQRLCYLLMMLHYEIIVHGPANQNSSSGLRSRGSFKGKLKESIGSAEVFLKTTAKQLLDNIKEFCRFDKKDKMYSLVKKLTTQNTSTQVAVTIECLKKVFSTMDVNILLFLKDYVRSKRSPPNECFGLIVYGLALFLHRRLRTETVRDIKKLCEAVIDVLNIVPEEHVSHEAKCILEMLLFEKTPVIREYILCYYLFKQNKAIKDFEQQLLREQTRLLSPFLNIDRVISTDETKWQKASGSFKGLAIVNVYHKSEVQDYYDKNESQLINYMDTMHISQVNKLRTLHHEHIIKMFAYQITSIPRFYVLEDFVSSNLQTTLVYRNDYKKFFSPRNLMRFLTDTIEALYYCHSRGIIHRNLTAESLFFVDFRAKLHGFHLAIDLDGLEEKTVLNGWENIPTRWSAPESLSKLNFSKRSDVYMYGTLMYEVLTHGALPYSHTSLSSEKFVQEVTDGNIYLCHETCIKKDVYDEIVKCVSIDPSKRPDISTLRKTIGTIYHSTDAEDKPKFPALSENPSGTMRKPSITFEKGIPDQNEVPIKNPYGMLLKNISMYKGVQKYQFLKGHLFQEWVALIIPHQLQELLNGMSKDIIPSCMSIHAIHDREQIIEYFIPSLQVELLYTILTNKYFGGDLCKYLFILIKVAELLENLHHASLVLGDFNTSTVYLEQELDTPKVHVVSWANLNSIQTFSDQTKHSYPYPDAACLPRTAPEVRQSGLYSPASDVYCFGCFLKEFLTALYQLDNTDINVYDNGLDDNRIYAEIPDVNPTAVHDGCKQLIKIAEMCIVSDRNQRPTLAEVIQMIERLNAPAEPVYDDNDISSITSELTVMKTIPNTEVNLRETMRQRKLSSESGLFSSHSGSISTLKTREYLCESEDDVHEIDQLYKITRGEEECYTEAKSNLPCIATHCKNVTNTNSSITYDYDFAYLKQNKTNLNDKLIGQETVGVMTSLEMDNAASPEFLQQNCLKTLDQNQDNSSVNDTTNSPAERNLDNMNEFFV